MAPRLGCFVAVPLFCTPLTRNRRFADAVPDPEHLQFIFFEGPPKPNRCFWLPLLPPGNSRSRVFIFFGPPTQWFNFFIGFPHPYSWHFLRAVLRHLGAFLGPSWAILGAVLGPFWAILEPSWGLLRHLGAFLGPSWAILGPLPLGSPSTTSENDGCKSKQQNWPPGAHLFFFYAIVGGGATTKPPTTWAAGKLQK